MNKKIIIAIPIYNEEKYIIKCVKSVLDFKIPVNYSVAIFLIDGMSTDKTRQLIQDNFLKYKNIFLVDNPGKFQSQGLNIVIKNQKFDYLMRLDAHTIYPKEYLINCYNVSKKTNAENVGGIWITMQSSKSYESALVQALTTHSFGVGNAYFRTKKVFSKQVDTVPFGFFKGKIFQKIGLFDERLIRCQDYEFNRRIKLNGGKVWIDSSIYSSYYNKSTLKEFYSKQFYKDAPYNPYMWHIAKYSFEFRHAVTGLFSMGIILGGIISIFSNIILYLYVSVILLYVTLSLISSVQQAIKYNKILHILFLPICFFLYHFLHGLGVLIGIKNLIFGLAPFQNNRIKRGF